MSITIKYCCNFKCFVTPVTWDKDNIPCIKCNAFGFCHCKCINYPYDYINYLRDFSDSFQPYKNNVYFTYFCCDLECFPIYSNNNKMNDITCKKCKYIGRCNCKCLTWMQHLIKKHCCHLLCIDLSKNDLAKCELCKNECLCRCHTFQKKMVNIANLTIRINKKLLGCVYQNLLEEYCCIKNCFKLPNVLIYGTACNTCNNINYCKCACVTQKEENL